MSISGGISSSESCPEFTPPWLSVADVPGECWWLGKGLGSDAQGTSSGAGDLKFLHGERTGVRIEK